MPTDQLDALIEQMLGQAETRGLELLGPDGVLTGGTQRLMQRALEVDLADHLGYEKGDLAGWGTGNNRNGTSPKTVLTDAGAVPLNVPRDRNGTFAPKLVPKHQRRIEGFNDLVLGLVSRGMTVRDTQAHLRDLYGVDVSPEQMSKITDAVLPELRAWQARPLDAVYPILFLDAIVLKIRDNHTVIKKGHRYLTVVCNHATGKVVWAKKGRKKRVVEVFFAELGEERAARLEIVTCDGASWIHDVVKAKAPDADICLDTSHVICWATKAVDEVRRDERNRLRREGNDKAAKMLKGTRWLLLRNWANLKPGQKGAMRELHAANVRLGRAWELKEDLSELFRIPLLQAEWGLKEWLLWASRSKRAPFVKLARTIRRFQAEILATIEYGYTNGLAESNNA